MDRVLHRVRFDGHPDSPSAAKQWVHWLDTFAYFLDNVYDYILGCATYQSAIDILTKLYIKSKNYTSATSR